MPKTTSPKTTRTSRTTKTKPSSDSLYAFDAEKRAVADQFGDTWVSLDGIGTRADTHGRFNHPSDLGMQLIADAFWAKMEPQVAKIAEKRAK